MSKIQSLRQSQGKEDGVVPHPISWNSSFIFKAFIQEDQSSDLPVWWVKSISSDFSVQLEYYVQWGTYILNISLEAILISTEYIVNWDSVYLAF